VLFLIVVSYFLFDNNPLLFSAIHLLVFTYAVATDKSKFLIVYLFLLINSLFILFSLYFTDGIPSYLFDESFTLYYSKSLILEILFWITFITVLKYASNNNKTVGRAFNIDTRGLKIYPVFVVAIFLLLLEISLSYQLYLINYSEAFDTGTVAYELGCLFLAIGISNRGRLSSFKYLIFIELIGVLLALFIVLATGKRLPFSFIIMAYASIYFYTYGKFKTITIFFVVAVISFLFGIFRDFMSFESLNEISLINGFYSTNQGAVLHASSVYVRIVDDLLVTNYDRFISFIGNFIGTIFLPISMLPEQVQVNIFSMQHYPIQGNGGLIGAYSYFFLGWIGPFLLAIFLALLCSIQGPIMNLLATIIILTAPRWTLYNIGPVIRLMVMSLFIILIMHFFSSVLKKIK
jgi:hypothetical protein